MKIFEEKAKHAKTLGVSLVLALGVVGLVLLVVGTGWLEEKAFGEDFRP